MSTVDPLREHQVEFCQKCLKRSFSPKLGVICSLTNERATFSGACPDYTEDAKEAHLIAVLKEDLEKTTNREETMGLSRIGINNRIWAGAIIIVGSLIWLYSLRYYDIAFRLRPGLLLLGGLYTLYIGIKRYRADKKKIEQEEEILDSKF